MAHYKIVDVTVT